MAEELSLLLKNTILFISGAPPGITNLS